MGFDQYHEPPGVLSAEVRTFARMITSLTEEAEAIGWYAQRLAVEKDEQARAIMENAQHEEMITAPFRQHPHPADIARALGHADHAAGVEQVEQNPRQRRRAV